MLAKPGSVAQPGSNTPAPACLAPFSDDCRCPQLADPGPGLLAVIPQILPERSSAVPEHSAWFPPPQVFTSPQPQVLWKP